MNSRTNPPGATDGTTLPQLLDLAAARQLLGGVSTATVYRLVGEGALPMIKIRRRTFFRYRDLLSLIDRGGRRG
jgi:hypothetical protein